MNNVIGKAKDTWEAGKDTAKTAITGGDNVKEKWHHTLEEAKEAYEATKDATKDTARNAYYLTKDKTQDLSEAFCNYVSNNPLKSIAVALLVGWIFGKTNNS